MENEKSKSSSDKLIQSLKEDLDRIKSDYKSGEIEKLKSQLEKNSKTLSELRNLDEKLASIDGRIKLADAWLDKVPELKEKIAEFDNEKLTVRAISEEQIQKTTAYKIIQKTVPAVLLTGIVILLGGVVVGGIQISSVMDTANQTNSRITSIRENFEDNFQNKTESIISDLAQKEEEAANFIKRLKENEKEADNILCTVQDRKTKIESVRKEVEKNKAQIDKVVETQVDNRLEKYKKELEALNASFKQTVADIARHKRAAETVTGDIVKIKESAESQLKQQKQAIQNAVNEQTQAYFKSKLGLDEIRNIEKIRAEIKTLDKNLTYIEQRARFVYIIIAFVAGTLGFLLSVLLWILKPWKKAIGTLESI